MTEERITNVWRYYHARREADGRYILSPDTQRILEQIPGYAAAEKPRRRRDYLKQAVVAALREHGELTGPDLYQLLREINPAASGTVRKMHMNGHLQTEIRGGVRYYRLTRETE